MGRSYGGEKTGVGAQGPGNHAQKNHRYVQSTPNDEEEQIRTKHGRRMVPEVCRWGRTVGHG